MKLTKICALMIISVTSLAARADFDQVLSLTTSSSGTYYVNATIGNAIKEKFLVDTGSSLLTINKALFKKLQLEGEMDKSGFIGLRLATGKIKRAALYHIKHFALGDNCQLGEVDVAYIPEGNNILGLSLLNRVAPFALQTSPPQLMLSNCQAHLLSATSLSEN